MVVSKGLQGPRGTLGVYCDISTAPKPQTLRDQLVRAAGFRDFRVLGFGWVDISTGRGS